MKHNIVASWMGVCLRPGSVEKKYKGWIKTDVGAMDVDGRLNVAAWTEFCRKIANKGANQTRIFMARPFVEVKPGVWDLAKFSTAAFADLKQMIAIAKGDKERPYNIRCIVTIFDECEFHLGRVGPYSSNIQKVRFYNDIPLSLKILRRFVAELGNTCDYEVCNEAPFSGSWNPPTGNVQWFSLMYEELLKLKVPAKNILYGAYTSGLWNPDTKKFEVRVPCLVGHSAELWRRHGISNDDINASRFTIHNVGGAPETVDGVLYPYGFDTQFAVQFWGSKAPGVRHNAFVSDDGIGQNDKPMDADGRWTRPSPKALGISSKYIFQNATGWSIEVLQCVDQLEAVLEAFAQSYKAVYGVYPDGYGKWPKPVIVDPVEPEPEPPDVPVKPPFNWQGWWNNRIAWIVKNRGIVAVVVLISLILFWTVC